MAPAHDAFQKLYVLQSLSMLKPKKPLQQMLKENQSVVKEACLEYLRPKEYHCLCTGRYWREKQRNTEFYSSQALPKANPDKKDAAEYLHDSRLNLLHVLVNIAGQPFETGVLEIELQFSPRLLDDFERQYRKLEDIRNVLTDKIVGKTPNYMQLMTVMKLCQENRRSWLIIEPPGTGKTLAAILCAIYLNSMYTCIFADTSTHSEMRREILAVDPNASVISTSLDTIKGALAKLSRCHDASSKPINHPDRTVAHRRVYFLIQREVVQHKSMESLLSKDKAREALRQLEALDDQISWGLVIIDELHQYLGQHRHTTLLSRFVRASTSTKLLGMTASPIGAKGLDAWKTIGETMSLFEFTEMGHRDNKGQLERPQHSTMIASFVNGTSKEATWDIMETHRFFAQHSMTLTLPTPLPHIQRVFLKAKPDMLPNLTGLKYEKEVKEVKAEGLQQLKEAGLNVKHKLSIHNEWTAGGELSRFQEESTYRELKDDMGLCNGEVKLLRTPNKDNIKQILEDAKVVLCGKTAAVGINDLQTIPQLVIWSPPHSCPVRQVVGRYYRPASSSVGKPFPRAWALCVHQTQPDGSVHSVEAEALDKDQDTDNLATAAIYGLVKVAPHAVRPECLDELLQYEALEQLPQVAYDEPRCKDRKYKPKPTSVHAAPLPLSGFEDKEPVADVDLLAALMPTADPDAHDDGKHDITLSPEQVQHLSKLTPALHDILRTRPDSVLTRWVKRVRDRNTAASTMSPYLLAISSSSQSGIEDAVAALDLEKFTSLKGAEKWLEYATLAAKGIKPPVAEIGFATAQVTAAWKVLETMRRKDEALTGRTASNEVSMQYVYNPRTRNINSRVAAGVDDPNRHLIEVETVEKAYQECMAQLVGKLLFAYNRNGFDERALFKVQLKADFSKHQQRPEVPVWEAAKNFLDNSEGLPSFLPVYQPIRQVLDILREMLEENLDNNPEHADLMQEAKKLELQRIPGTLNQAYRVICGEDAEAKHWSDVDSQQLFDMVLQLLTQTFVAAPCQDLLRKEQSWLRVTAEETQVQLLSQIRALRSRLDSDLGRSDVVADTSYDPVTLVLLESKRKAFQDLVSLAPADTDSCSPSPTSTVPATPTPAKGAKRRPSADESAEKPQEAKKLRHVDSKSSSTQQASAGNMQEVIDLT